MYAGDMQFYASGRPSEVAGVRRRLNHCAKRIGSQGASRWLNPNGDKFRIHLVRLPFQPANNFWSGPHFHNWLGHNSTHSMVCNLWVWFDSELTPRKNRCNLLLSSAADAAVYRWPSDADLVIMQLDCFRSLAPLLQCCISRPASLHHRVIPGCKELCSSSGVRVASLWVCQSSSVRTSLAAM